MPWPRRIDKELEAAGLSKSWSKSVRDMADFLDSMENEPIPKWKRDKAAQLRKRVEGYIEHVKTRSAK